MARDVAPDRFQSCRPAAAFDSVDPSTGWADLSNFTWIDYRLAMLGPGVITWSGQRISFLNCPDARYAHILTLRGSVTVDGAIVHVPPGLPTWVALPHAASSVGVDDGLLAIDAVAATRPATTRSLSSRPDEHALGFDWRKGVGGGIVAPNVTWIVLKERYSPDWRLTITSGRVISHVVASGYANAWQISSTGGTVSVYYDRWEYIRALAEAALLVWCAGIALAWRLAIVRTVRATEDS
jgi:hypothetical protein